MGSLRLVAFGSLALKIHQMSFVLNRFRAWNHFLPGLEDAPMLTGLVSGHATQSSSAPSLAPMPPLPPSSRYKEIPHRQCRTSLSFYDQHLVDTMREAPSTLQPYEVVTPFPSVHQLPTEMLAVIFAFCHAMDDDDHRGPATSCARVILSHVCHRWRAVILSMPLLWCTIRVHGARDCSLSRLKAHLERSMPCPLSISVMANIGSAERKVEHVEDIISLAVAHAQRWKSLRLYLGDSHAPDILNLIRTTSFPSIESLDVSVEDWAYKDSDAILEALATSSRVRSLAWCGPGGIPPNSCWATLAHIDISNPLSLREVHVLLSQCHLVVELRLWSILGDSTLDDEAPITSYHLEMLSVFTHEALDSLFDRLSLPRLKRLTTRYYHHIASYNLSCKAFDSLLTRSNCSLEEFVFRDDHMPPEALDELLRIPKLDALRSLSVEFPTFTDRILETLTCGGRGGCILPRLETLSFWRSQSTDGRLGAMATSRASSRGEYRFGNLKRLRTAVEGSRVLDRHELDTLKLNGMGIDYECW
ncbi:hypothetical protein HGRIS_000801 [Hohenbuehelia grisea]|uniref:F-box domain-containing protein n=1 Tax=Hohenbuehelia grisea TaxID=104357 RepID=A0ABR3IPS4_9AGAR